MLHKTPTDRRKSVETLDKVLLEFVGGQVIIKGSDGLLQCEIKGVVQKSLGTMVFFAWCAKNVAGVWTDHGQTEHLVILKGDTKASDGRLELDCVCECHMTFLPMGDEKLISFEG
jgi:hypothetical protein